MQRCPQTLEFLPSPPLPPWAYGQYIHRKNPEKIERPWKGQYLPLVDLVVFDIVFLQKKKKKRLAYYPNSGAFLLWLSSSWLSNFIGGSILPVKPRMKPVNNTTTQIRKSIGPPPPPPYPIKNWLNNKRHPGEWFVQESRFLYNMRFKIYGLVWTGPNVYHKRQTSNKEPFIAFPSSPRA